jgi:hypothetical protein
MSDTELLIRDCLSSYAQEAEQADLVRAAKAGASRNRRTSTWMARAFGTRRSIAVVAVTAVVLAFGAIFVVGSFHTTTYDAALRSQRQGLTSRSQPGAAGSTGVAGEQSPLHGSTNSVAGASPVGSGDGSFDKLPAQRPEPGGSSGVTATRVVKTGSIDLSIAKGQVGVAVTSLISMAKSLGGYVSSSHTDDVGGSPSGEVTLRMPVNKFDQAVTGAQRIGHQISLTTTSHDVTGRYVDLNARLSALQRTRSTYLTILSRASTVGQILSVQQRVDNTQSQIEQLQGELKVLRNQSADGTLTVDVAEAGSAAVAQPHHRSGIGKAWHDSVSRFSRGVDAIVGALGPLLLALILLGLATLIIRLGIRRTRRATT